MRQRPATGPLPLPLRLLLLWLLLLPAAGHAAPAPVELQPSMHGQLVIDGLEYLQDHRGDLDLEAVRGSEGSRFRTIERGNYHFPINQESYWFRFRLVNPSNRPLDWQLEYHQEYIDRLDIYVVRNDAPIEAIHYSVYEAQNPRLLNYRHLLAPFHFAAGEEATFYIRASRDVVGPLAPSDIRLWTDDTFQKHVSDQYFWFGLFYGGMFIALLYNLMLYFNIHEKTYLYYVFYLSCITASWLTQNGLGRELLWADNRYFIDHAAATFALLSVIGGSLYTRAFLSTAERAPLIDRFIRSLLWAAVAALLVSLFGALNTMINIAYLLIGLGVFTYPFIGAYIWAKGYKPARIYTIAWIFFGFGTLALVLQHHGVVSSHPVHTWAGQTGAWIEAILLSIALADRFNAVQREKDEAQVLYRETLLQAKLELEQKVRERTAELHAAKDEAEQLARVDVLTGMPNRRHFFEQAERTLSLARRYHHPLTVLTLDIDHFKQINDRYGHACGDEALKRIATTIPTALRETDIAGRIGGEEFAIVLPETDIGEGHDIAERLRQSIADIAFDIDGQVIALTTSIGIAEYDGGEGGDINLLLARADTALYQAKAAGRNQVVLATANA